MCVYFTTVGLRNCDRWRHDGIVAIPVDGRQQVQSLQTRRSLQADEMA